MKYKKLETGYISSLCMELYLILQAGIPMAEGMEILSQGEEDTQRKQLLAQVAATLYEGQPLHFALGQSGIFPSYLMDMIQVGEETGNLDDSLKGLSAYYDRLERLEQNIRRAVLYPSVLLTMLTLVLLVLIVKVLPMFNDVYAQLGGTLGGLGGLILAFGQWLSTHWVIAILVVVVLLVGAVVLTQGGKNDESKVLCSKKLGLAVATAKLTSVLAMALQSGLDPDRAVEMAGILTNHPQLRGKVEASRDQMAQGTSFATAMANNTTIPSLYCRMLEVGTRTGTMDEVMEDIARRCDTTAQDEIDRYIGSVEPTLVMVMSLLVGVVLLSVMLPLASIMTSLG